ncbi:MAG: hypothetical protein ACE362_21640 [Phaeodactylibacter xiamenensis]|uniref:Lipocalin-like domain-containing protein n=1 Tax=Phaeodactylibacter xiamenensis TaxID=1524460 RepID=A0A098S2A1_9BACT|nr:hypothetical protein [Phaeodactylibacter xiamenensis]KGE86484.1 hypothetical protein IX84_22190 [Phaeodactylibacter xiamenensis]MCR9054197.1 hypothetical protein [bacterium]
MKMIRKTQIYAAMTILSVLLLSCKKEEPSLTHLITGDWEMEKMTINGQAVNVVIEIELEEDGDFQTALSANGGIFNYSGEWEVDEASGELELKYDVGTQGMVGSLLGAPFPVDEEKYEIELQGDEMNLQGVVVGIAVELELRKE